MDTTRRCLLLLLVSCTLTHAAPLVESNEDDDPLIGERPSADDRPDFSVRRNLADGEEELFVQYKGNWASQLSYSHPDLYTYKMLTSTDGAYLVKSIYDTDGRLTDCDVLKNQEIIRAYAGEFQSSVNQNSNNGTTTSLKVISDENVATEEELKLLNVDEQRKECTKLQRAANKAKNGSGKRKKLSRRSKRSYLIYPGTNWCGKGNKADHANHMGPNSEEDKCCRQHDLCPYAIEGFSSRFNMFNYRLHTLSHCDCEKQFKECLKEVQSGMANIIGKVYFNVVNTQCFDLKLDKTCTKRTWWGTCDKKQTQWIANVNTVGTF